MKKAIQTTHQLNASADAIWNTIKSGNKWEDWFPILTGSQTQEGNKRVWNDCLAYSCRKLAIN